jgi:hypothetical protein
MLVSLVAFGPDSDDAQSSQDLPLTGGPATVLLSPTGRQSTAPAVPRALVETRCSASAQGLTRQSQRYSAMAPLPIS